MLREDLSKPLSDYFLFVIHKYHIHLIIEHNHIIWMIDVFEYMAKWF